VTSASYECNEMRGKRFLKSSFRFPYLWLPASVALSLFQPNFPTLRNFTSSVYPGFRSLEYTASHPLISRSTTPGLPLPTPTPHPPFHSTSDHHFTSLLVKQINCTQNCQILLQVFLSDGDPFLLVSERVSIIIFSAFSEKRAEDQNVFSISCNTINVHKNSLSVTSASPVIEK